MTVFAATWFDAGLVAFQALVLLSIGAYYWSERRQVARAATATPAEDHDNDNGDGRRAAIVGWIPVAASLPAVLLPWFTAADLSGAAYDLGYRLWLLPLAVLLALPVVALVLVPLSQRMGGADVLDYLADRFGPVAGRLGWVLYGTARCGLAAAVLAWSCRQATAGAGVPIPAWLLVLAVGGIGVGCAVAGRVRGLTWLDLWQSAILLTGLGLILLVVWHHVGLDGVADTARRLGRGPAFRLEFQADDGWSIGTAFPAYLLLAIGSLGLDLVAQRRWSRTGNTPDAQRSLLVGGTLLAAVLATLVYIGVGLLDFYHRVPAALRGRWVANLDSLSRRSLTDPATRRRRRVDPKTGEPLASLLSDEPPLDPTDGTPLLDWYADEVDSATIPRLIAERRLLRPNDQQPFVDSTALRDPRTGSIAMDQLLLRRPTSDREIILNRRAAGELLPWFVATRLPWGCLAIAWCGLLASAISATSSTTAILGGRWSAGRATTAAGLASAGNTPRWCTGGAIVGLALVMLNGDLAARLLLPLAVVAFGPLLVGVLLGLTMRRGSAATVVAGMTTGLALALLVLIASAISRVPGGRGLIHPLWALPVGVVGGWLVGSVGALVASRPRSRAELRGLVFGCGPLGVRQEHSAVGSAHEFVASAKPSTLKLPSQRWRD